jgi:hypothetical protein
VLGRRPKWLVVALLIFAVGAQWAFLQSAAWIGMLASNLQTASFHEAWTRTFDGKHPCRLCKLVSEGKKSEQKQERLQLKTQIDFFLTVPRAWIMTDIKPERAPAPSILHTQLISSPVSPPPRLLA